ncbi:MAG TPA: site-specific integrase, partial [Thiobacillaceae bacterium]|nr:site-specific integrase [Thiobacillaceae bacterium]
MATIRKRSGKWQARVQRHGHPDQAKTFLTRADAERWARQTETEIERGIFIDRKPAETTTLETLINRYRVSVTPQKKGAEIEAIRLRKWAADPLSKRALVAVKAVDLALWRDQRIRSGASNNTVRLELAALSVVFEQARLEWGFTHLENPVKQIRKPNPGKPRDRRLYAGEFEAICRATQSPYLVPVMHIAMETAMRLGEIVSLQWQLIDLKHGVAKLINTKNGDTRHVPLSRTARSTIQTLPCQHPQGLLFDIIPHAITVAFRRSVKRARLAYEASCMENKVEPEPRYLVDLHFHDLRHEAVSRLFEKGLNV